VQRQDSDEESLKEHSELHFMGNDTEDRLIRAKMTALTKMFTCLQNTDGVSPFDANRLDEWAAEARSHGERCAAQFFHSGSGFQTQSGRTANSIYMGEFGTS